MKCEEISKPSRVVVVQQGTNHTNQHLGSIVHRSTERSVLHNPHHPSIHPASSLSRSGQVSIQLSLSRLGRQGHTLFFLTTVASMATSLRTSFRGELPSCPSPLPPPPFPPCKVPVGLLSKPVRSRSGFSWPLQVPLGV